MKHRNAPEDRASRVACCQARARRLSPWADSRPRWRSPPTGKHVTPPPVPAGNRGGRGESMRFLLGHAVGTQDYICLPLRAPASPGHSSRRRPRCSRTTRASSSPRTSSAPIRSRKPTTFHPAWQHSRDTSTVWAAAGRDAVVGPFLRRAGCDSLAPASRSWSRSRTQGWRRAGGDDPDPAAEHLRRSRAFDRLLPPRRTSATRRSYPTRPTTSSTRTTRERRGRRRLGSLHEGRGRARTAQPHSRLLRVCQGMLR